MRKKMLKRKEYEKAMQDYEDQLAQEEYEQQQAEQAENEDLNLMTIQMVLVLMILH